MKAKLEAFWSNKENRDRMQAADKAGWEGRDDRREAVAAGVSAARRGKPLSPEHRAAIKAAMANVPYAVRHHLFDNQREASRAASLGRIATPEQREALSIARKAYEATIRLPRLANQRAKVWRAMDKWHPCECTPGCIAVVKSPDKQYARSHHPNSTASLARSRVSCNNVPGCPYNGKQGYIEMRSSWEMLYAVYLDCKGVDWKYESKAFTLKLEDRTFSYTPDFYLPATDEYVEVKGYFSKHNKRRMKLFASQYPDVKLSMVFSSEINDIRAYLSFERDTAHP